MDRPTDARVLFSGQHWPGANSMYIARAFERCGAVVRFLNETGLFPAWESRKGRIIRRLLTPLIESEWNNQLHRLLESFRPNLVYITNAHLCWPQTLDAIHKQGIPVMCFYHDPQWDRRKGSRFAQNIPLFDLIATTRRWHETEFRSAGAKQVHITRFGYEPSVHRPLSLTDSSLKEYEADVAFIGSLENQRSTDLASLLDDHFPYRLRIWGNQWGRLPITSSVRSSWQRRAVYEQEIPVIYAASKIALHWINWEPQGTDPALRKGDQHNSRTFQITACGGAMMLAQRTEEHSQFFEEGKEAVFFNDVTDLREKLNYWLAPDRERQRKQVAQAARERCLKEDYSYVPVVRQFLEHFGMPISRV